MIDWIADHPIWVLAAFAVIIAGVVTALVLSGAADCPKGQSAQFAYYQPVVTTINGVTSVTMQPVYTCQADHP